MTQTGTTFATSPSYVLTSESVTEGHPDKLCDQVSDAILDAIYEQDPQARVACETATGTNFVAVIGEITTTAEVNYETIVRETIKRIGYDNADIGIDYKTCEIVNHLHGQSPDIKAAVDTALEDRGETAGGDDLETGAGDQGMMVGFACNETPELMPLPISLAHQLTRRLTAARREGVVSFLKPDGKSQVTVEYEYGKPKRIDTIVVSTQHSEDVSNEQIDKDVREHIIGAVVPRRTHRRENPHPRQSVRPIRDRRPARRRRPDRTQDHRGHVRGRGAPRRRRLLRERPHEGGPLSGVRRPLGRKEHRRRGARRPLRSADLLRHRRCTAHEPRHRDVRHGQGGD